MSREEIRDKPPHVLITNYSMLEYMLLRPQDDPIFKQSESKLKYIVLDEAHVYTASLAGDISLLLRRAMLRFKVAPMMIQGFATSATFWRFKTNIRSSKNKNNSNPVLKRFVADLFSQNTSKVEIIKGTNSSHLFLSENKTSNLKPLKWNLLSSIDEQINIYGESDLEWHNDGAIGNLLVEAGFEYYPDKEKTLNWKFNLGQSLERSGIIKILYEVILNKNFQTLNEIHDQFKNKCIENNVEIPVEAIQPSIITLLRLGAIALNKNGNSFQPLRIHAITRGLNDGFTICLNETCSTRSILPKRCYNQEDQCHNDTGAIRISDEGICKCEAPLLPIMKCNECDSLFAMSHVDPGNPPKLFSPERETIQNVYERSQKKTNDELNVQLSIILIDRPNINQKYLYEKFEIPPTEVHLNFRDDCYEFDLIKDGSVSFKYWSNTSDIWKLDDKKIQFNCPCCLESQDFKGKLRVSNPQLRYPILSSLLTSIPKEHKSENKPGFGKRILTFSDSRQEAARLAHFFRHT